MIGVSFSIRISTRWARAALYPYWLRSGLLGRSPPRVVCQPGVRGRIAGDRLGAGGVQRQIGGQREGRQPGRLHRVEVAVDPGLVLRLPLPAVDLGASGGERADLGVVGQLRPAHRVHDEPPRDAERDDREQAGARRVRSPALRHSAIVQGSGLRTATTSSRRSRKRTNEARDQCWRWPGVLPSSRTYLRRPRFKARHSGSRGTLTIAHGLASPATISSAASRVVDMLHHLAAQDQLGGVVPGVERLDRRRPELHLEPPRRSRAGAPRRSPPRRCRSREPAGRAVRAAAGAPPRRSRPRAPPARRCRSTSRSSRSGTRSPAGARPGCATRTCRRRCRPRSAAASPRRSQPPTSLRSRRASKRPLPVRRRAPGAACRAGLVVRWLDAASSSSRRTRSKVRWAITRWPAIASPTTPEPEHLHRDQGQHRAEDQRLDVAASVAVEDPVEHERGQGDQRGDARTRRRRS